jgi:hypothetical protein
MPASVEGLTGKTPDGETLRVREVWADNLVDEITLIRDVVEEYPYVAMDTEFPGVVVRPVGSFKNSREYHYKVRRGGIIWCAAGRRGSREAGQAAKGCWLGAWSRGLAPVHQLQGCTHAGSRAVCGVCVCSGQPITGGGDRARTHVRAGLCAGPRPVWIHTAAQQQQRQRPERTHPAHALAGSSSCVPPACDSLQVGAELHCVPRVAHWLLCVRRHSS